MASRAAARLLSIRAGHSSRDWPTGCPDSPHRSKAGPRGPAKEPSEDAAAKATPLEDAGPQASDALQDVRADALGVPAMPRGEDAAPDLPQVRLLQGPGSSLRRGRVTTGRAGREQ